LAAAHVLTISKVRRDATSLLLDRVDYIEKQAKVMFVTVPSFANAFVIFETLKTIVAGTGHFRSSEKTIFF